MASEGLNIAGIYGSVFLAGFISAGLWGIFCMQCFFYYVEYRKDNLWLKLLVAFLWAAGTSNLALIIDGLFSLTMVHFGDIPALSSAPPSLNWMILPSVSTLAGCQLFFTYRLWKFSGHNLLYPVLVLPAIVVEIVTHLMYMKYSLEDPTSSPLHKHKRLALVLNVVTATTDVCLALGMIYHLQKERTWSRGANRMVIWLIIFTVNSGIWTALAAVAILATITVLPPTNLTFAAIYLLTSPLYCNACLGNLIARRFLRNRGRQNMLRSTLPLDIISEDTSGTQPSVNINSQISQIQTKLFQGDSQPSDDSKSHIDLKENSVLHLP